MSLLKYFYTGPTVRGLRRAEARRQRFVNGRQYRGLKRVKHLRVDADVARKNKLEIIGEDVHRPGKVWVKVMRLQVVLAAYAPSARARHRWAVLKRKEVA